MAIVVDKLTGNIYLQINDSNSNISQYLLNGTLFTNKNILINNNIINNNNKFLKIKSDLLSTFNLSDIEFAGGIRKLHSNAISSFELRRDSDNSLENIGYNLNDLNLTDVTNHLTGSTNGYIRTLYNQPFGVTGNNITETGTTKQLLYNNNGQKGLPFMFADNTLTDNGYNFDSIISITNFHLFFVGQRYGGTDSFGLFAGTNNSLMYINNNDVSTVDSSGVGYIVGNTTRVNRELHIYELKKEGDDLTLYVDNQLITGITQSYTIGDITKLLTNFTQDTDIYELILFNRALTNSERTSIVINQFAYYSDYVPLYILLGQSNMAGTLIDTEELPTNLKKQLRRSYTFNNSTKYFENLLFGVNNEGGTHGIELTFCNTYSTKSNGGVAIVKKAKGSTGFNSADSPDNWRADDVGDNNLLRQSLTEVNNAINERDNALLNFYIAGLIWYQGEEDTSSSVNSSNYDNLWLDMYNYLKTELALDSLPVILIRINYTLGTFLTTVINKQTELASNNEFIELIKTDFSDPLSVHKRSLNYQATGVQVANKLLNETSLPLEGINVNDIGFAFGLRRLHENSKYATRIRASANNSLHDIGFLGFDFDDDGIVDAVSGGTGYFRCIYNQISGTTGNDADEISFVKQSIYGTSGQNGKSFITINEANQDNSYDFNLNIPQPDNFYLSMAIRKTSSGTFSFVTSNDNKSAVIWLNNANNLITIDNSITTYTIGTDARCSDTNFHIFELTKNGDVFTAYVDGDNIGTITQSGINYLDFGGLFRGFNANAEFYEGILIKRTLTDAERTQILTNQQNYYGS